MNTPSKQWDVQYEWRAVLLLSLGFGLVGLDRWIITPVFPSMMHDLNLTYQDLGNTVGALAIFWGLSAVWMGRLADQFGRRKVAIPALIAFSLISALTGVVTGMVGLLLVRALMGVTEGAYAPACTAAAGEASEPSRRGRGQGFVFCAFPLLGLGVGPVVATQLLQVVPSWRWVFYFAALPGLVLAVFLYRVLREPAHQQHVDSTHSMPWSAIFRSRNVLLAILTMVCAMSCIFVLGTMIPSYLVDYLHLAPTQMGFVMSAMGIGGCLGNFLLPAVSDYIGRKAAVVGSAVIAALALLFLTRQGADTTVLYAALFIVSTFSFGILATTAGPIATESVAPQLASSAIGVVSGASEIFGGGIAPIIAGFVATRFGIQYVLYIGLVGLCLAIVVGMFLLETAPRMVRGAVLEAA